MTSKVGNFITSVDTTKLVAKLLAVAAGDVVHYADLSLVIGRDVTAAAYAQLRSARKQVLREHLIDFAPVPAVGLRRLPDVEVADNGPKHVRAVHRAAKRHARRATAIQKFDELPNERKIAVNTTQALLGTIAHATTSSKHRRLREHIANSGAVPSLSETLEHFKK